MGCFTPFTYTILPCQLWYHTSDSIKPHSYSNYVILTSRSSIVQMLLEIGAYMQACALYGASKLECMQQAIHIQELLHMSPRDLKCLFDRIEMKHQLHLTILLRVAIDCRQRIKIEPIADLTANCNRSAAYYNRTLTTVWRRPEKGLQKSCRRRGGKQAQCVYGVQPSGEVDEELQYLLPA